MNTTTNSPIRSAQALTIAVGTPSHRVLPVAYPSGIVYADRNLDDDGYYKRLAFLDWNTLIVTFAPDCPDQLREDIILDVVASIKDRHGEDFPVPAFD